MKTNKKLPAYGKPLRDRLKFNNPPFLVVVCVGGDAWRRAKNLSQDLDYQALVLDAGQNPGALQWPVSGLNCLIDWDTGPSEALIVELVKTLLRSGAPNVVVNPLWVDVSKPSVVYDTSKQLGQRWTPARESLKLYRISRDASNAA